MSAHANDTSFAQEMILLLTKTLQRSPYKEGVVVVIVQKLVFKVSL